MAFHARASLANHLLGRVSCVGCGALVSSANPDGAEMFMLHDEVWRATKLQGIYCVGCTEAALGRQLVPADFNDALVNRRTDSGMSSRLRDRLGLPDQAG